MGLLRGRLRPAAVIVCALLTLPACGGSGSELPVGPNGPAVGTGQGSGTSQPPPVVRCNWDPTALMAALDAGGEVEAEFPSPFTGSIWFRIVESPLMSTNLGARYPDLRTWRGQGLGAAGRAATLRLVGTPWGFFAQVLSPLGNYITRPSPMDAGEVQDSDYQMEIVSESLEWIQSSCHVEPDADAAPSPADPDNLTSWSGVRVYNLAVAATDKWVDKAAFWVSGEPKPSTAQSDWRAVYRKRAFAALLVAVSRVTQIFERELSIRFRLVDCTDELLALDQSEDKFPGDPDGILRKAAEVIATRVDLGDYHVGHVLHGGQGGLAAVGCVSGDHKAEGCSGWGKGGDNFAVDLFAHELGHQFGARHTFNREHSARFEGGACEPGSGSTIMSYAGRCGLDNVQGWADPYFHADSAARIIQFIQSSGDANPGPLTEAEPNHPPIVPPIAGPLSIPRGTAFVLRHEGATDPDGDDLTYCWEQMDCGTRAAGLRTHEDGNIPLFRSFPPTLLNARIFPVICEVFRDADRLPLPASDIPQQEWRVERVPKTGGRNLKFRLTVRDNRSGGGARAWRDVVVTVDPDANPLEIRQPPEHSGIRRIYGGQTDVNWEPGDDAPLANRRPVRIRLTFAGGRNWHTLLEETENDGEARVSIPNGMICGARIRVESTGTPGVSFFAVTRALDVYPNRGEIFVVEQMPVPALDAELENIVGTHPGTLLAEMSAAHVEAVRYAPAPAAQQAAARKTAAWFAHKLELNIADRPSSPSKLLETKLGPRRILYVTGSGDLPSSLTQLGLTREHANLLRQQEPDVGAPVERNLVTFRATDEGPIVDFATVRPKQIERRELPWADRREFGALRNQLDTVTLRLGELAKALAKPEPEADAASLDVEAKALGKDLATLRRLLDRDLAGLVENPRARLAGLRDSLATIQRALGNAPGTPREKLATALKTLTAGLSKAGSEFESELGADATAALRDLGRVEQAAEALRRGLPRPDSALSEDVADSIESVLSRLAALAELLTRKD